MTEEISTRSSAAFVREPAHSHQLLGLTSSLAQEPALPNAPPAPARVAS